MVTRIAAGLAAAFGLVAGPAWADCHAEVEVVPPNPFVGEAVEYRVQILLPLDVDRVEWTRSPAFAHVRTERLPGSPKSLRIERHGEPHLVSEERRMLFVERAGSIPLEAPDLLCRLPSGSVRVAVPTTTLSVRRRPPSDVPTDVVGPIQLQLTVTPERVSLGETVRVALRVRGIGNVWDATDPFDRAEWGEAEVFAMPPEVVIERGRHLRVRKHFIADVVPRGVGTWTVPAFTLAYFDPKSGSVRTVKTPARRVEVSSRRASTALPADPGSEPAPAPAEDGSAVGWPVLLGVALTLLAGGLAWRARAGRPSSVVRARESLASVRDDADAEALARILRSALADRVPDAASATPEELAVRPGLPPVVGEAAALLEALERARFDPEAPTPDAASVQRVLARL